MKVVGHDPNGHLICSGLYDFKSTYGLPLAFIMDALERHDMIVAIDHYVIEGLDTGTSSRAILAEVVEALGMRYGPVVADVADARIKEWLSIQ